MSYRDTYGNKCKVSLAIFWFRGEGLCLTIRDYLSFTHNILAAKSYAKFWGVDVLGESHFHREKETNQSSFPIYGSRY